MVSREPSWAPAQGAARPSPSARAFNERTNARNLRIAGVLGDEALGGAEGGGAVAASDESFDGQYFGLAAEGASGEVAPVAGQLLLGSWPSADS